MIELVVDNPEKGDGQTSSIYPLCDASQWWPPPIHDDTRGRMEGLGAKWLATAGPPLVELLISDDELAAIALSGPSLRDLAAMERGLAIDRQGQGPRPGPEDYGPACQWPETGISMIVKQCENNVEKGSVG